MSVSRFTTLALALGALTAIVGARAQTTRAGAGGERSAATTTTPTAQRRRRASRSSQRRRRDAAARIQALEDRIATLEKAEAKARRRRRPRRRDGDARRTQRPLGRQRVQLPTARLRAVRRAVLRRERAGRTGIEHVPAAPRAADLRSDGVQVLRPAPDARLRQRADRCCTTRTPRRSRPRRSTCASASSSRRSGWSDCSRRPTCGSSSADSRRASCRTVTSACSCSAISPRSRVQYQVGAFDGAPDAAIVDGDVVDGEGRRGPRVPPSVRDEQLGARIWDSASRRAAARSRAR